MIFIVTYLIPGSRARGEPASAWRGQIEADSPEDALERIRRERPHRRSYAVHLAPGQDYFAPAGPAGRTAIRLLRIQARDCEDCQAAIVMAEDQHGRWHCLDPLPLGGPSGELDTYARHICRPTTGDAA